MKLTILLSVMGKYSDRLGSLTMAWKPGKEKKKSELKTFLDLKTNVLGHAIQAEDTLHEYDQTRLL